MLASDPVVRSSGLRPHGGRDLAGRRSRQDFFAPLRLCASALNSWADGRLCVLCASVVCLLRLSSADELRDGAELAVGTLDLPGAERELLFEFVEFLARRFDTVKGDEGQLPGGLILAG